MSRFIGILIWSLAAAGFAQAGLAKADSQNDKGDRDHHRHHTVAAPEIDPAAAGGALTLLAGGLAVVRGRRKK
jgi:hypothetical protein